MLEIDQLRQVLTSWVGKKKLHSLVPRLLQVSLAPKSEKKWHRLMLLYHAKMVSAGLRPVQEFPLIENYFGRYVLREILADATTPKYTSEKEMVFAWDSTVLNEDGQDPDMNGIWHRMDFEGELD